MMLEHQWEIDDKLWAYRAASHASAAVGHVPVPAEGYEAPPACNDVASEVSFAPIPARAPTNPKKLSLPYYF